MRNFVRISTALLLSAQILPAPWALMAYQGKVVDVWPESTAEALRKPGGGSAAAGLGLYRQPPDTTLGLTVLVDFSDQSGAFTVNQVNDWLNKSGYNLGGTRGSVRDFFLENSHGKWTFNNELFGYYRAKHPKAYYEESADFRRAEDLVMEVIEYLDPLVDFKRYDNDRNGATESFSIVYAGSARTWAQGLWPHAGWTGQTRDGVKLDRYNMVDMGNKLVLYGFCHEVGHMVFNWPDLYYFGDYCLMGNGMPEENPVPVNDFFRADQGWLPYVTISPNENRVYEAIPNTLGFLSVNPADPNRMYFWSAIRNTGRWSHLKGRGLLMFAWDKGGTNSSGKRRRLSVVEADGDSALARSQWPDPGSATGDFFYAGNRSEFSPTATPAAGWNLRVHSIGSIADTMTFAVGNGQVSVSAPSGSSFPRRPVSRRIGAQFPARGIHEVDLRGRRNPGSAFGVKIAAEAPMR